MSFLGFFSAFSHGHLMFITLDPPDDWYCEKPDTVTCNKDLEGAKIQVDF